MCAGVGASSTWRVRKSACVVLLVKDYSTPGRSFVILCLPHPTACPPPITICIYVHVQHSYGHQGSIPSLTIYTLIHAYIEHNYVITVTSSESTLYLISHKYTQRTHRAFLAIVREDNYASQFPSSSLTIPNQLPKASIALGKAD